VLGANGVLDFASLSDPEATAETLPEGTLLDWTAFSLGKEGSGGGGGGGMVDYEGTVGGWVAFPTSHDPGAGVGGLGYGLVGWSVKWRNGEYLFLFLLFCFSCFGGVEETAG
jgi:hypothetical protein